MSNIYDLHQKAFPQVSAYVVMKDGVRVATIALKFPKDGAGRLWAYVHWLGIEMQRGYAGGYGYDKRSAAVAAAADKIAWGADAPKDGRVEFCKALRDVGGEYWDRKLEAAGFTVLQAV